MSYQVLARKWRPRNFSTLVGQEHVVRALTHALNEQRLHHAYLFTGTRGVGKTTLARILAKSLNCEAGITATPCGACSACQEIDAGRFVDLLEVDAATNTRVDEMRQLLENAVYAPTRGRFKVYVIDEVHMLSNSAFNAMLKTLEEPPEHVKFILATTDPQKIPVTVLSRCLQFNLKQMPEAAIGRHLAHILQAEGVEFEGPSLGLIARAAAGSMRDALSLLDQAIAHGAGRLEEPSVRAMLGVVGNEYTYRLLEAVRNGSADELFQIAGELGMRSLSFSATLQELAVLVTRLQLARLVPSSIDESDPDAQRLTQLAKAFSGEALQLFYQIVVLGRQELPLAPDEYSGFLMVLFRLLTFRPESVADYVATRPQARPISEPAPQRPPASAAIREPAPVAAPLPPTERQREDGPPADWRDMVAAMKLTGLARELAQNCELRTLTAGQCLLRLPPAHAHLQFTGADKLQQALNDYLGRPVQMRIETGQTDQETPARAVQREKDALQKNATKAIEGDAFVRDAVDLLDASVVDNSIRPIG